MTTRRTACRLPFQVWTAEGLVRNQVGNCIRFSKLIDRKRTGEVRPYRTKNGGNAGAVSKMASAAQCADAYPSCGVLLRHSSFVCKEYGSIQHSHSRATAACMNAKAR